VNLVGALLLIAGLLMLVPGILAWNDLLPPNAWVGIRTRVIMRSPAAWYAAHRVAAPWLVMMGAPPTVVGIAELLRPPTRPVATKVALVTAAYVAVLVVIATVKAERAARRVPD